MKLNVGNLLYGEYLQYLLPGLILLVTGLVVAKLVVKGRNKVKFLPPKAGGKSADPRLSGVTGTSAADRRESIRRDGTPVEVVVTSPTLRADASQGYVLDRSTGGLRLALTSRLAPGSSLQVKARNAPDTTPWVTVIVRNCQDRGEHFEIGCEFEKTPPWNVLLLFG